jgi:epoxyqueuosine reductase
VKDLLEEAARTMGLIPAWAPLKPLEEAEKRFRAWLEAGRHGGMAYLRRPEERFWPEKRFPWAKSALLLFAPYAYEDPGRPPGGLRVGRVARYAWSRDYHLVLGEALGALAAMVRSLGLEARGYVDHGSLPERALAVLSGAGWVGKSGMFLSQAFGVHAFIGVLLTPLEVEAPPLHPSRCGRCVRCLQACPTGALLGDGTLDARICISYLTVEERGFIPFYANAFVLGHQWNRVCRLRVSGSWARTRHRSATTSIISSRSRKYRLATASFTRGHTRSTGWSSGE